MINLWHHTTRTKQLAAEDKRLSCPFCFEDNVQWQEVPGAQMSHHYCAKCGATGPLSPGSDVVESRARWNTRWFDPAPAPTGSEGGKDG